MSLLFVSFIAGLLTVLAPCILPVIPVIVGSSLADSNKNNRRLFLIIASLAASIITFTLLLKATTALLGVPQFVWQLISGVIIIILGVSFVFPRLWETFSLKTGLGLGSQQLLARSNAPSSKSGVVSAIATGAALGPVFASCSPTYLFIVAAVLPIDFWTGLLYLLSYTIGLVLVLLAVSLAGKKLIHKLGWALNPNGWFRRGVGVLLIVVGVGILFGGDKQLQALIIDSGLYAPLEHFENSLR